MRKLMVLLIGVGILVGFVTRVQAGEIDVLVNKLVEKGVLTQVEGSILIDETQAEVAKQNAKGTNTAIPTWVQKISLKGDARVRYQWQKTDTQDTSRNRARIRYRLGIVGKANDQWEAGAGLASAEARTGSTVNTNDPRSTNITLENSFDKQEIRLDYMYAQYKPSADFKMIVGKFMFPDYLWQTTDLMWDGDINPAGASASYSLGTGLGDSVVFLNSGAWILEEYNNPTSKGPWLWYGQAGLQGTMGEVEGVLWDGKLAGTYYGFSMLKDRTKLDWSAGTNSLNSSTYYTYDYEPVAASAQLGVNNLFGGLPFHIDGRLVVFGDYVYNMANDIPKDQDTGFAVGAQAGYAKVEKWGDWQLKYIYGRLEKDAWLDVFPDSDRLSGKTNMRSHEAVFTLGLARNVSLGLDWYESVAIKGSHSKENLFQADINVKF